MEVRRNEFHVLRGDPKRQDVLRSQEWDSRIDILIDHWSNPPDRDSVAHCCEPDDRPNSVQLSNSAVLAAILSWSAIASAFSFSNSSLSSSRRTRKSTPSSSTSATPT